MIEEIQDTINLLSVDKTHWKPYKFEEIAQSVSKRVEPKDTELDIYVGLEHLDSDSIHIKRWGKPSDVEGTKLRFYKGDIIFGRRRAYQRKAAIAEFDGICSAHALVLRANPEVILPELFPFFLHSDTFMNRAVDISVGSLSPTINWGTLKHQEFLLPPKEQQARIAELLWAADEMTANYFKLKTTLERTKDLILKTTIKSVNEKKNPLKDITYKITSGGTPSRENNNYYQGNILWAKSTELKDNYIIDTEERISDLALSKSSAKLFPINTVLIAMYGVTAGKLAIIKTEMATNQAIAGIICNPDKLDYEFLFYYLLSIREKIIRLSVGSAQPNLNLEIIRNLEIPEIPINDQLSISKKLTSIDSKINSLIELSYKGKRTKAMIINQIF